MKLKELFDKSIFLIGAGASMDAECLSSAGMLSSLKTAILQLDKPDENNRYNKHKEFQKQFLEIYDFIVASLNYQFTLKGSSVDTPQVINIEDFVMVLKQIIDREFIVPYPLVGNWNDKITKWEISNGSNDVFREFLNFIVNQLTSKWTSFDTSKAKKLLAPVKELLTSSESFKLKIFSLNYDLVFENTLGSFSDNLIETGFISQLVSDEKLRIWNDSSFTDENSKAKLHLYKLHGSLNWEYDSSYELIKEKKHLTDGKEPLIIFGSANKMLSFDPFLFILSEFRKQLSNSSLIIVIGYSFHDKYINNLLIQQLQLSTNRRMIVVDPKPLSDKESTFASKLETIQTIRSVNDLINFKKANPKKITILKLSAKAFLAKYFSNKAQSLKELLQEAEKEETIF